MRNRWQFLVGFVLLLSLVPAATASAQGDLGACLYWDVSGTWEYAASLGGYGIFVFDQDRSTGALGGRFENYATGGSASWARDQGGVVGQSLGFHPVPQEDLRGTVDGDGKTIRGTMESFGRSGTWNATGQAECVTRQEAPPAGSANFTTWWGSYSFRTTATPAAQRASSSPLNAYEVGRIIFPGSVKLTIRAVYYGDNLPTSLEVINIENGVRKHLGYIYKVRTRADGGVVYEGMVTVKGGGIGIGERRINEVKVVDPWDKDDFVSLVVVDQVLIDPSGYIYDVDTNEKIEGATVSAWEKQGDNWVMWDAENWKQINPQISDDEGQYGWETTPGDFQVRVSHDCYMDAQSEVVTVPPPRTDVHIPMKKVTCSPVKLDSIWTTDEGAIPKTAFEAGDTIQFHAVISNSGTTDVPIELVWTVQDSLGRRIDELSGSGDYAIAPAGAGVSIEKTLPGNDTFKAQGAESAAALPGGQYRLTMSFTHLDQTSIQSTSFGISGSGRGSIYLPMIIRRMGTQPPAPQGIHGKVTYDGAPAAGVELALRFWNGSDWSTKARTATASDGSYLFMNMPSLGNGQKYYVRYGLNSTDTRYVSNWFTPDIVAYTAGSHVAGGDFDIKNIVLDAPQHGATVSLPKTFSWIRRMLPGDSYRWGLFEIDGDDSWWSNDLGDTSSFTLGSLPTGANYGQQYGWQVWICQGADNCGLSYYYRGVTFEPSQAGSAASEPAPGLVPAPDGEWSLPNSP